VRAAGVGAVAAAALVVAGCGSSSSHPSASVKPAPAAAKATINGSAIARAADVSGAAAGEKVAYTLTGSAPSLGNITVTGVGSFNRSPAEGQMTVHIAAPGASSLGAEAALLSNLQLTLVFAHQNVYLKLPSSLSALASSFTGGKTWLEINLAKLGGGAKTSGLSSLLSGKANPTDPAALLKQLAAASANGVKDVGSATVDGASTTEYSADLDLAKLTSSLTAKVGSAATKQQLAKAEQAIGATKIPVDIYIDSANLIRRITFSVAPAGSKTSFALQMDFLSYGAQSAPTVPAPGITDNLSSLVGKIASGQASVSSLLGG
jgi:hypothetical protein